MENKTVASKPRRPIAFHAILWSFLPVLAFYVNNYGTEELSGKAVLAASAILAIPTAIVFALSLLWKRKHLACCLLISLFWVLFFAIGHIVKPAMEHGFRYRYLMLIYVLTLLIAAVLLFRTKKPLILPTRIMNRITIAFILILGVQMSLKIFGMYHTPSQIDRPITLNIDESKPKPDIYYFLVDGYPGSDILKSCYDFDNTPFTDSLKQKGCWVPQGFANYFHTRQVMPSLFLMDYLQNWLPEGVSASQTKQIIEAGPAEYPLLQAMRQADYEVVLSRSQFAPTGVYRSKIVTHGKMTSLSTTFVQTFASFLNITPAFPFAGRIVRQFATYSEPKMFAYFRETLGQKHDKPRLFFAHFILPHPPVRYTADGTELMPNSFAMDHQMDWKDPGMIGQFQYLNSELKSFVDKATALPTDQQPVILIHSDHGSATRGAKAEDWNSPTKEMIEERTSIFCAAYLPGIDPQTLPKQTSPVNMFRLYIQKYLDPNFPLLEDKTYFAKPTGFDFKLVEH